MIQPLREFRIPVGHGSIINFKDYEAQVTEVLLAQGSLEAMIARRDRLKDESAAINTSLAKLESVWRMRAIGSKDYHGNMDVMKRQLDELSGEIFCLNTGIAEAQRIEAEKRCEQARIDRAGELEDLRETEPMLTYMSNADLRGRLAGEEDELTFLKEMCFKQGCRVELFAHEMHRRGLPVPAKHLTR